MQREHLSYIYDAFTYFHIYLLQQEAEGDLSEFSKCVFSANVFMWDNMNMALFGNATALFMHDRMHR